MKRVFHKVAPVIGQMNTYPFCVLILFLYGAVFAFAVCAGVMWFPQLLENPHRASFVGEQWFQIGNSLLGVGGMTAPLMDLILHKDGQPNSK